MAFSTSPSLRATTPFFLAKSWKLFEISFESILKLPLSHLISRALAPLKADHVFFATTAKPNETLNTFFTPGAFFASLSLKLFTEAPKTGG